MKKKRLPKPLTEEQRRLIRRCERIMAHIERNWVAGTEQQRQEWQDLQSKARLSLRSLVNYWQFEETEDQEPSLSKVIKRI